MGLEPLATLSTMRSFPCLNQPTNQLQIGTTTEARYKQQVSNF